MQSDIQRMRNLIRQCGAGDECTVCTLIMLNKFELNKLTSTTRRSNVDVRLFGTINNWGAIAAKASAPAALPAKTIVGSNSDDANGITSASACLESSETISGCVSVMCVAFCHRTCNWMRSYIHTLKIGDGVATLLVEPRAYRNQRPVCKRSTTPKFRVFLADDVNANAILYFGFCHHQQLLRYANYSTIFSMHTYTYTYINNNAWLVWLFPSNWGRVLCVCAQTLITCRAYTMCRVLRVNGLEPFVKSTRIIWELGDLSRRC